MEELISRPFVGQIEFQLVLLKRIETESAMGGLVFLSRSLFLFPRSLLCSKLDSLPAHSLEIWLER